MNNKDFIADVAKELGRDQESTQQLATHLIRVMSDCFDEGNAIPIPHFGVFEVTKRMEYIVVKDNKKWLVPPRLSVEFKSLEQSQID